MDGGYGGQGRLKAKVLISAFPGAVRTSVTLVGQYSGPIAIQGQDAAQLGTGTAQATGAARVLLRVASRHPEVVLEEAMA